MTRANDLERRQSLLPPSSHKGYYGGTAPIRKNVASGPARPVYVDNPQYRITSYTQTISTELRTVAGANEKRRYIVFQNNSTIDIFLGFGTPPNLNGNNSFKLQSNAVYLFDFGIVPNNEVIAVSTSQALLTIVEGVEA